MNDIVTMPHPPSGAHTYSQRDDWLFQLKFSSNGKVPILQVLVFRSSCASTIAKVVNSLGFEQKARRRSLYALASFRSRGSTQRRSRRRFE